MTTPGHHELVPGTWYMQYEYVLYRQHINVRRVAGNYVLGIFCKYLRPVSNSWQEHTRAFLGTAQL